MKGRQKPTIQAATCAVSADVVYMYDHESELEMGMGDGDGDVKLVYLRLRLRYLQNSCEVISFGSNQKIRIGWRTGLVFNP
jgi:hypothetical protein